MTDELTTNKISNLIEHWIEHNNSHIDSYTSWSEKIKQAGHAEVAADIIFAAQKINESSTYLQKALEKIHTVNSE